MTIDELIEYYQENSGTINTLPAKSILSVAALWMRGAYTLGLKDGYSQGAEAALTRLEEEGRMQIEQAEITRALMAKSATA